MKTPNTYSARIILNVDEFFADSTESAEKIIDSLITELAKATEAHSEVNWEECDFDIIPENEIYEV